MNKLLTALLSLVKRREEKGRHITAGRKKFFSAGNRFRDMLGFREQSGFRSHELTSQAARSSRASKRTREEVLCLDLDI
jgi:hypothetical protein